MYVGMLCKLRRAETRTPRWVRVHRGSNRVQEGRRGSKRVLRNHHCAKACRSMQYNSPLWPSDAVASLFASEVWVSFQHTHKQTHEIFVSHQETDNEKTAGTTLTFTSRAQRLRTKHAAEGSEGCFPSENCAVDFDSDRRATTSEKNVDPNATRSDGLNRPNESFLA